MANKKRHLTVHLFCFIVTYLQLSRGMPAHRESMLSLAACSVFIIVAKSSSITYAENHEVM